MEDSNKTADEIKPYMFEPMPNENTVESGSSGSDTSSSHASEDEIDEEFEEKTTGVCRQLNGANVAIAT